MRTSPLRRSGVDHTVLPANTQYLHLPRSSPEGATTEWTVIAPAAEAYYSLIDSLWMKGWVGLVASWLTYSGRFTHTNGYPSATGPVQTSESSPVRDRRSTTELHHQPQHVDYFIWFFCWKFDYQTQLQLNCFLDPAILTAVLRNDMTSV